MRYDRNVAQGGKGFAILGQGLNNHLHKENNLYAIAL